MWPPTHWKGYQGKLLIVHSKGGWCNIWGLLYCDDRKSPLWASRDGPWHDRSRSDIVIISMNFNSYASSALFFIIPVLFCFVFEHGILYTIRMIAMYFFLPYLSLQSYWAWKPSKPGLSISFLFEDFRLCLRYSNLNYGAWHIHKPFFGSSVATCRLAFPKFHFQLMKKAREKSRKRSDTVQFVRWRDNFSSGLCFVFW